MSVSADPSGQQEFKHWADDEVSFAQRCQIAIDEFGGINSRKPALHTDTDMLGRKKGRPKEEEGEEAKHLFIVRFIAGRRYRIGNFLRNKPGRALAILGHLSM